jgi:phosphoglycolate phosphatase
MVVNEILRDVGVMREEVLYVGDSGVDMRTAVAAGVRSVGVTWGFRSREELVEMGADYLADRAEEILNLL